MRHFVLITIMSFASPLMAQESAEEAPEAAPETAGENAPSENETASESAPEDEARETPAGVGESAGESAQPEEIVPADREDNPSTPSATEQGARAKFALVVIGDADAALQSRAAELSMALHDGGLTGVHDGAIAEALAGGAATEGDGLDALRRARRTLSLSDDAAEQADALERIGRASGADALVLLARRAPLIRVYDLGARSFFQDVPEGPSHVRFIVRATRAAAERAMTAPIAVAEAAEEDAETAEEEEEVPPVRAFFKKNWPYMVAGVLLAGAIVWLVVGSGDNDDAPPPVLRFRPGGSE